MADEWARAVAVLTQQAQSGGSVPVDTLKGALTAVGSTVRGTAAPSVIGGNCTGMTAVVREAVMRAAANGAAVMQTLAPLPFEALFACLAVDDEELIETACEIVKACIFLLPFALVIQQYKAYAEAGLNHPYESVRVLALSIFEASVAQEQNLRLLIDSKLFDIVSRSLGDASTRVSALASDLLVKACKFPIGLEAFLSEEHVSLLLSLRQRDATVKFRVFGLAVQVASQSELASSSIIRIDGLLPAGGDLSLSDPLAMVNNIEICCQLAHVPHGVTYMAHSGIITTIHVVLAYLAKGQLTGTAGDADLQLTSSLIGPTVTRWLGELSPSDIEFLSSTLPVTEYLCDLMVKEDEPEVNEAAVSAVGNLGKTLPGLQLVAHRLLITFANTYGKEGPRSPPLRTAFHTAIGWLLAVPADNGQIARHVFDAISTAYRAAATSWPTYEARRSAQVDYTTALITDVNEDARWAGYALLERVALHAWGRRHLMLAPGLMDHLLNREKESEPEGVRGKYAVLSALDKTDAPTASGDPEWHAALTFFMPRIQRYLREGVFYKEARVEVAGMVL